MKRAVVLAALLVTVAAVPAAAQGGKRLDGETLRKELEVMRRLIAREAIGRREGTGLGYAYAVGSGTSLFWSGSSDAVYAPGVGAILLFDVSYPVAGTHQAAEASPTEPTLWDRISAEVDGRRVPAGAGGAPFDSQRVDDLADRIIDLVGRYGANLASLRPDESITVVVSGRESPSPAVVAAPSTNTAESSSASEAFVYATYATALAGGRGETLETVLSLSVPVQDVRAVAEGRLTPAELRTRVARAQY